MDERLVPVWFDELLAQRSVAGSRRLDVPPTRVGLAHRVEHAQSASHVLSRLSEFGGEGWVCFTGQVVRVDPSIAARPGTVPVCSTIPTDPALGFPLSAELSRGTTSLHLRHQGGAWRLDTWEEREGDGALAFDEILLCTEPDVALRYRVWWCLAPEVSDGITIQVWQPHAAGFRGWDRTSEETP